MFASASLDDAGSRQQEFFLCKMSDPLFMHEQNSKCRIQDVADDHKSETGKQTPAGSGPHDHRGKGEVVQEFIGVADLLQWDYGSDCSRVGDPGEVSPQVGLHIRSAHWYLFESFQHHLDSSQNLAPFECRTKTS